MAEYVVRNVICPKCKKQWTASLSPDDKRDTIIDKDCAAGKIAAEQAKGK